MKTNFLARMYAMAMIAVFAVVATAGVALMMTQSGESTLTQVNAAAAAAQMTAQSGTPELSQWKSATGPVKQVL